MHFATHPDHRGTTRISRTMLGGRPVSLTPELVREAAANAVRVEDKSDVVARPAEQGRHGDADEREVRVPRVSVLKRRPHGYVESTNSRMAERELMVGGRDQLP